MTDPARYIRKAVIAAIKAAGHAAYDKAAPGSATAPYCLVTIGYEQLPVKHMKHYRASISIELYNEFREEGGSKALDEMTDDIFGFMVPDNSAYLPIENFEHVNCKLLTSQERIDRDASVTTFIKALRFESLIQEN